MKPLDISLKVEKETILFNSKMASVTDDSQKAALIKEYHDNIEKVVRENKND